MCTVTFLPVGGNSFLLTSNRDENLKRKTALPPARFLIGKVSVFFPKDQEAGGTWIATANNHFTLCLLNGGFEKHIRTENYRISRGQVLLDFFNYNSVENFARQYSFAGVEPFTLIIAHSGTEITVNELVWDGKEIHTAEKNPSDPHIWSSVTLYNQEVIEKRNASFRNWLGENPNYDLDAVLDLHTFGGIGEKANDFVMHRNEGMQTVSTTSIFKSENETKMVYKELGGGQLYSIRIL